MRHRKLGLVAFLAAMLTSLLMAVPAMATPTVTDQFPIIDVQVGTPLATVQVADLATSTTSDPVTVESADSPCNGSFGDTAITFDPSGLSVTDQASCAVFLTDGSPPSALVFVTFNIVDDESPPGDTVDPVVEITSPSDGISVPTNSVVISYTATDNVGVVGCNVANGGSVNLTPGPNEITINCTDAAGNVGSDTVNVIYDAVAPVVTITSPADGSTLTMNPAALAYTVDDQDPSPTCSQVNGSNVTLDEGLNEITVECTDAAGNTGSDTVNVTYAPPPPSVPTLTVSSAIVTEGDPGQAQVYAKFQVTLSNAWNQDIDILYWVYPGTATSSDVELNVLIPKVKTIPAGATSTEIWIPIKADFRKEKDEIFFLLYLSCDIDAAGITTGRIKDDVGG